MTETGSAHGLYDIAVIGGGVVGWSVAYFASELCAGARICVIEPDSTYEFASTLRASGGCRVQFSCHENIDMSLASLAFIRDFSRTMSLPDRPAEVDWVEGGYLFIVPPAQMRALEANVEIQRSRGCEVDVLTPAELKGRFPSISTSRN